MKGYIGTYNSPNGKGIYSFDFNGNNGELSSVESLFPVNEGKCLYLLDSQHLVITLAEDNKSGIGILDLTSNKLIASYLDEIATPCFVYCKDNMIYTANYHDGVVMVYSFEKELKLIKKIEVQPKAGCHQVVLFKNYLIVPCLLIDEVHFYDVNDNYKLAYKIKYSHGTGPRHGIFNKEMTKFYLVSELSNQLFIYNVQLEPNLNFTEIQTINLLDASAQGASSAAIRLNNAEDRLYISTRGADLITVIKLGSPAVVLQQLPCGGIHPRDFILTEDNKYLLVVNKDSDDILSWGIQSEDGKLSSIISKVEVPHGIGIILEK